MHEYLAFVSSHYSPFFFLSRVCTRPRNAVVVMLFRQRIIAMIRTGYNIRETSCPASVRECVSPYISSSTLIAFARVDCVLASFILCRIKRADRNGLLAHKDTTYNENKSKEKEVRAYGAQTVRGDECENEGKNEWQ